MNENEIMEQETALETTDVYDVTNDVVDTESEGGRGGAVALAIGGLTAITAAAVFVVKKIKNKKAGKPKKQKTKLRLVRVPVDEEDEIEVLEDEFVEDEFENEN